MPVAKEEILSEIRKYIAANNGKVPGERTFKLATRIKESAWKGRFWVRWTDAIREAGFAPNEFQHKTSDAEILQKLSSFITSLGRFPVRDEINLQARREPGFPLYISVNRRFGGIHQIATRLLDYGRETENIALIKLCKARLDQQERKPVPARNVLGRNLVEEGFVYLKYSPSLRLYKIGKAKNPDRRGAGISLLLPEDLVPRHEIKTDCPYILERYWGYRFRAKKRQGEWYDLNSEDVESFKRRREFMFCEFFP